MTTNLMKKEQVLLPSADTLQTMLTMSDALFKSGLLPGHIKSPQAALAVIQKGMELGIPPMYAMSNIAVIQGKPTANAELMLALIYRDHGDNAIVFKESSATRCTILYRRANWSQPQEYSFTIEDAKRAGLSEGPNWKKYPAAMLRARCLSAVARMAFPDSIGGMYTPEEMGAVVNETGELIERAEIHQLKPAESIIETVASEVTTEADFRVSKEGDSYIVQGESEAFEVYKADGATQCTCEEYRGEFNVDPKYICPHKRAVIEYAKLNKELNSKADAESVR